MNKNIYYKNVYKIIFCCVRWFILTPQNSAATTRVAKNDHLIPFQIFPVTSFICIKPTRCVCLSGRIPTINCKIHEPFHVYVPLYCPTSNQQSNRSQCFKKLISRPKIDGLRSKQRAGNVLGWFSHLFTSSSNNIEGKDRN